MTPKSIHILKLFSLIILGLSFSAQADYKPIEKHLKDATVINRARAPLYSELSNARSWPLSYELIAMENLALVMTNNLDIKARPYLEKGIGVFHDDLTDMIYTPKFSPTFVNNQAPVTKIKINVKIIIKSWIDLIDKDDLNTIYNEAVDLLDQGPLKETNQNCLTRHFVESIARSIMNLEKHNLKAKELSLNEPKKIIVSFLKLQVRTLIWAQSLDKRAFPIQRDNIPLFCQDVPLIPYK
jgi:hypothetical protein